MALPPPEPSLLLPARVGFPEFVNVIASIRHHPRCTQATRPRDPLKPITSQAAFMIRTPTDRGIVGHTP
jgi:hypothetical protein